MHSRRYRGVNPDDPYMNRFRGFMKLCGLKQREVAVHFGMSMSTVGEKVAGRRGITETEEMKFATLYKAISSPGDLPEGFPEGARIMQQALREAAELDAGIDAEAKPRQAKAFKAVRDMAGASPPDREDDVAREDDARDVEVFLRGLR